MKSAALFLLALTGCAAVQRVPLVREARPLEAGRFTGPITIAVPPHAQHEGHDYEVRVSVVARCAPLFTLAFPDGEQQPLGVKDDAWQALLRARAEVVRREAPPPVEAPLSVARLSDEPPAPAPMAPGPRAPSGPGVVAGVNVDAEVRVPSPTVGHWERSVTETWAGQAQFELERARRCAEERVFTARYRNAFDDTDTVALWADVPQELEGATLNVEVDELVTPKVAPPPPPPVKKVEVAARVTVEQRPPMPPPKEEHPSPPKDAQARWRPGHWVWSGRWVWQVGSWLAPATPPPPRAENGGVPPLPGCVWVSGHWVWVPEVGGWDWAWGHWGPPPPLDEPQVDQPDPTSRWIAGRWSSVGATFRWEPGRWGRPEPRAESPGPQPRADARWVEGTWVLVAGRWTWSAGFWDTGQQPPPPKNEVVPPRPSAEAVWLRGFWRWDLTAHTHVWIDGHWELPPGEGYVWVEEKLGPDLILRGHWELRGVVR